MNKILITGTAGFIGNALSRKLLASENNVIFGIDNHNNYYSTSLKDDRLKLISGFKNYTHHRIDISNKESLEKIFFNFKPDYVINLSAQAGVRFSIENPHTYIQSNVVGFVNILELSRLCKVKHLIYASSSSVYGSSSKFPYSTSDNVDHPKSIYAATKKSNELMAHVYSDLYNLPTTGLRFFTVYGPWGRPDMALFKFTKSILNNEPIDVYNYGNHKRDFTYIDDIIDGLIKVIFTPAEPNLNWNDINPDPSSSNIPWKIYNLGNNVPISLIDFIETIEKHLNKKAIINFLPMQKGDVLETFANIDDAKNVFGYQPKININTGVLNFVNWYKDYYKINL